MKDIKKEPQGQEGQSHSTAKTDTPTLVTHKQEKNCRGSPQGAKDLSSTLGSQILGPHGEKTNPQNVWFEGQWGLLSGDPEGYGNRDSTLKERTQNLTVVETQSRNFKRSWSELPSNCGEFPQRGNRQWELTLGTQTQVVGISGTSSMWTLVLASIILESSLQLIGLTLAWSGPKSVDTNTRRPQVMQLTGQNPTHQQTGCPKTI